MHDIDFAWSLFFFFILYFIASKVVGFLFYRNQNEDETTKLLRQERERLAGKRSDINSHYSLNGDRYTNPVRGQWDRASPFRNMWHDDQGKPK